MEVSKESIGQLNLPHSRVTQFMPRKPLHRMSPVCRPHRRVHLGLGGRWDPEGRVRR